MKQFALLIALVGCLPCSAAAPAFEAASIRPNNSGPGPSSMRVTPGLHLESKKIPMPVVVIDSAERPSGN